MNLLKKRRVDAAPEIPFAGGIYFGSYPYPTSKTPDLDRRKAFKNHVLNSYCAIFQQKKDINVRSTSGIAARLGTEENNPAKRISQLVL